MEFLTRVSFDESLGANADEVRVRGRTHYPDAVLFPAGSAHSARDAGTVRLLVDQYASAVCELAELKARVDAVEATKADLESRLTASAGALGVQQLAGTHGTVICTQVFDYRLPTKGRSKAAFQGLDQVLRISPHWPEVSMFDRYALRRIWQGTQVDPGNICAAIAPFVEVVQETKLRFFLR